MFLSYTEELRRLPEGNSFVDAAQRAVAEVGGLPVGAETEAAGSQPSAQARRALVQGADVYVAVLGFRYGSPLPEHPELSCTEWELYCAEDKLSLVFLLDEIALLPHELFVDDKYSDRQTAFRRWVADSTLLVWKKKTVASPEQLHSELFLALRELREQHRLRSASESGVFISYRRDASWHVARLLYDRLLAVGYDVFMDLADLGAGEFESRVLVEIGNRPNFVVLLDPATRLDRPTTQADWVRREIVHALRTNRNVVPVLTGGFTFGDVPELPSAVSALAKFNAIAFYAEYLDEAVEKLRNQLRTVASSPLCPPLERKMDKGSYTKSEARSIGIRGEFDWPCYNEMRDSLVAWAMHYGLRLRSPQRNCMHWLLWEERRCRALVDERHNGTTPYYGGFPILDHVTCWESTDGQRRLMIAQPYRLRKDAEPLVRRIEAEWPVQATIFDRPQWYESAHIGIEFTKRLLPAETESPPPI